ncbi:ABC transporter ATP-binding protein [Streptomyces sp. NPDC003011]
MNPDVLLTVRDLRVSFGAVEAVRGLSFDVREGEVLAVVGESGAGKSLTARALLGMPPREATVTGSVRMGSHELVGAPRSVRAALWGRRVALVPQDALSALSPVHPVVDQLAASLRSVHRVSRKAARARAVTALEEVGIPADQTRAYPHEFSGGMRQRAVIAMAMLHSPALVIADEPTTAQDPQTQRQILDLLARKSEATGTTLVLVTHDLPTVREHADRVLVMYAGRLVEEGPVDEVFARPRAPYTAGLLASVPVDEEAAMSEEGSTAPPGVPSHGVSGPDRPLARRRRLPSIAGAPPAPTEIPPGCPFAPRCPLADADRCRTERPEPEVHDGRTVACHRWRELPDHPADLFLESA